MEKPKIPLIALVGLPNSGKSTLLNRLTGTRKAVVAKEAHTTRDLNYGEDFWDGYYFRFVDTGGLVPDPSDKIQKEVQLKSWSAVSQADLLVWVIDRKQRVETLSEKILKQIWRSKKPFIIAINKVDDPNLDADPSDYAFLGGRNLVNMSCNIGYGLDSLMDAIIQEISKAGFQKMEDTEFVTPEKKVRRKSKTKDVKPTAGGNYMVVRREDGLFESVDLEEETAFGDGKVSSVIVDFSDTLFLEKGNLNQKVADFLIYQKSLGYKLFYLSNSSQNYLQKVQDNQIFSLFDGGLPSENQALNEPKPSRQAFYQLLSLYNLVAEETIFIDDDETNILGAKDAGLKTIRYQQTKNLFQEFTNVLTGKDSTPKVMFLGKPNVGKSSLFNAMVGKDIQIVTDIAGTTMSVNDTLVERKSNQNIELSTSPTLENAPKKYLIFDFDGVLGDTWEALVRTHMLIYKKSREESTEAGIKYFMETQHAKKDNFDKKEILEDKRNFAKQHAKDVLKYGKVFEAFVTQIQKLENVQLAIVTSAHKEVIQFLLDQIPLDFDYVYDAEDSLSKEEKVEMVCKNWGVSDQEVYYFTDTVSDVLELEKYLDNGKVIGCSWGFLGHDRLKTVLPESQILDDFSDILNLFPENYSKPKNFEIEQLNSYVLLDSVGIRRPGQRTFGAENFATFRTIQTAHQADVICLVLDGSQPISHQDQVVAGIIREAGKGVVVIVNKADLVEPKERLKFIHDFETKFAFLKIKDYLWVSAVKALENQKENRPDNRLGAIWESVDKALEQRKTEISKTQLRKLFNYLMKKKPPNKLRNKRKPIIYDLLYTRQAPPTFHLLVKDPKTIHWSYLRFLENTIRANFNFRNTEIRVKLQMVEQKKVVR